MHPAHGLFLAMWIVVAICFVTSDVAFFRIVKEVNSKHSPEQQFSWFYARLRLQFFEIINEHERLFPKSWKRRLLFLSMGIGTAVALTVLLRRTN